MEEIKNHEELNEPSFYAIIPAIVRYCPKLCPNEKLLYGEITALTNQRGYCFATNAYFAKLYDVAKGTVSKWVSNLENEGFIITFDHITSTGTQRRIKLGVDEKLNPPTRKDEGGYTKKDRGVHEKLNHNNTVNTTSSNLIKIGTASFLNITAILNIEEYRTIYNTVMAKRKNKKITDEEFLAVLNDKYCMTEFKDRNHFINALNKSMEVLEANKSKGNRKPNSGMVY